MKLGGFISIIALNKWIQIRFTCIIYQIGEYRNINLFSRKYRGRGNWSNAKLGVIDSREWTISWYIIYSYSVLCVDVSLSVYFSVYSSNIHVTMDILFSHIHLICKSLVKYSHSRIYCCKWILLERNGDVCKIVHDSTPTTYTIKTNKNGTQNVQLLAISILLPIQQTKTDHTIRMFSPFFYK